MKKWILVFVLVARSFAATTVIVKTVVGPDNIPATGKVSIKISSPCESGTNWVGDKTILVSFTPTSIAGTSNFKVSLVPNDSGTCAGTSYTFAWQLLGGATHVDTVVVPTSNSPLQYDSLIVSTPGSPSFPGWPPTSNLANGVYAMQVTNGVPTWVLSTGGTPLTTLSWATLTDQQWSSMSDAQWAAIGN